MHATFAQTEGFANLVEKRITAAAGPMEGPGARLTSGAEIDYITLSREMGSYGEEIGQIIAELMDWGVYDKKVLNFMADSFGVDADLLKTVDERTRSWIEDTLSLFMTNKQGHIDQLAYYKHLIEALLLTAKHGRAVIIGRAAGHVLPRERGLSVRITAPFEIRSQRYADRHDMSIEHARAVVSQADERQRKFVKGFLDKDAFNMQYFDIVCNTEKFSPDAAAKLIWRTFDQRIASKEQQARTNSERQDVRRFIEQQIAKWKLSRKQQQDPQRQARLMDGATVDYITVGRQIGSGGEEIAEMLAKWMHWECYDKKILDYMAKDMAVHVQALESVDEKRVGWIKERFGAMAGAPGQIKPESYHQQLAETLMVIAEHGRAVIVGRAAGAVLPRERGLSVFITAPFEVRCRRYAQQHEIEIEQARTIVKRVDNQQSGFFKDFLGQDIHDPNHYDLMCNTEKLEIESVAKIIWRAFDQRVLSG